MDSQLPAPAGDATQGQQTPTNVPTLSSFGGKEREVASGGEIGLEVSKDAEELLPQEVKEAGIVARPETVELPPDLKSLGVQASGASQPVIHQGRQKTGTMTIPLSDPQIIVGLHKNVTAAVRWLAEWCILQLKRAHIKLRSIKGKIFRVTVSEVS